MSRITKAQLDQAYRDGYNTGLEHGRQQGLDRASAMPPQQLLDAKIKLFNAVGQTMQVNASLLSSLAQTLDNGPR